MSEIIITFSVKDIIPLGIAILALALSVWSVVETERGIRRRGK